MINNYFLLALFLFLNLITTVIRTGLMNVRYAHLISLREKRVKNTERTIELVTKRAKTRSSLRLTQSILRFLMAVLAI